MEDCPHRIELYFVLEHCEFCVTLINTSMTVFEKTCYYIMCLSRVIVYISICILSLEIILFV